MTGNFSITYGREQVDPVNQSIDALRAAYADYIKTIASDDPNLSPRMWMLGAFEVDGVADVVLRALQGDGDE